MANDQFGILKLFPTRTGGREWYLPGTVKDIMADGQSDGDLKNDISGGNTTDGFTVGDNSQVRLKIASDSSLVGYSKPSLNQADAKSKGFMDSTKEWDIMGLEMTCRFFCTDFDTADSRFILKGPTGSHKSNTKDCSGSSYGVRFFLAPSGGDSGTTEFFKEQWHVHYVTKISGIDTGLGSLFNKWVVVKYVINKERVLDSNAPSGSKEIIRLRAYININNDGQTFKKVHEEIDSGGWNDGNGALDCNADVADEIMTWRAYSMMARWDGPIVKFLSMSVREVDVTGESTGEPEPTTGTLSKDYTFKYNLGVFAPDACGTGTTGPTLNTIYNVTDNGSQSNLHKERYRVGVFANAPDAQVVGKKPHRVIVQLSKSGTPPAGAIAVVLRKAQTDEVAVTFNYTGGTLDATALTGSKTPYTFENLTSNYVWQYNDILTVEYSGNTTDTVNEVNVFRSTLDPYDGPKTCARKFDNAIPPTGYTTPDLTRDYAWTILE